MIMNDLEQPERTAIRTVLIYTVFLLKLDSYK